MTTAAKHGPGPGTGAAERTLVDSLVAACAAHAAAPAIRHRGSDGGWHDVSYAELYRRSAEVAVGLERLGVRRGDRVAIFAGTRPEWTYVSAAAAFVGAVTVTIYPTSSADDCRHILRDSTPSVVVVEGAEQVAVLDEALAGAGDAPEVVSIEGGAGAGAGAGAARTLGELVDGAEAPPAGELEARFGAGDAREVAACIYTSGTTGAPKACMHDHATTLATVDMIRATVPLAAGEVAYLFLPLAHAFAQAIQWLTFDVGGTLVYWSGDQKKVQADLAETRPHYLPAVPRLLEKFHAGVMAHSRSQPRPARLLFGWALAAGRRGRLGRRRGGVLRRAELAAADRLVHGKIRQSLGGRLKLCVSGGAPVAPELHEFFASLGMTVLECYGMTEAPAVTMTSAGERRFGSVGRPFPGMEVAIAEDGEILVRGPNVFRGYWPGDADGEGSRDGWLQTGDVGRLDDGGVLWITGRKKDLIITSGGKNVAPAPIEVALCRKDPISQAVVYGDRRPYPVALIAVDPEATAELSADDVRAQVARAVDEVNATLARPARVKRFAILPGELSAEAGEVTPTMKVRRAAVQERHADEIERLYS